MTNLDKLAHKIYELMGLNQLDEHILKNIEDELESSYSPIEMEGEDTSIRCYGGVLYGGLDLIKDGKLAFSPLAALDAKHLEWLLKISGDGNLRISYMREDTPLQTWTIFVSFPEWPNKDEGEWLSGELVIEKSFYQRRISSASLQLDNELTEERVNKIYTMYSML